MLAIGLAAEINELSINFVAYHPRSSTSQLGKTGRTFCTTILLTKEIQVDLIVCAGPSAVWSRSWVNPLDSFLRNEYIGHVVFLSLWSITACPGCGKVYPLKCKALSEQMWIAPRESRVLSK